MIPARPNPPCHSESRKPALAGIRGEESAFRSSLDGGWIEIFRAGDYGERGRWTEAQLDQLAADYDPRRHAAPVVLGHPADDAPAYAWVKRLRRAGQSLWAQLEKVDPLLEALLRAGRFASRSVALYTHFPLTGGPYLRHLGFLGAAPPAVKGLAPVRPARRLVPSAAEGSLGEGGFADAACPVRFPVGASVTFAFDNQLPEVAMSESKSRLEAFFDHLRAFFTTGSGDESARADSSSVFADRLATLEQRLDTLAAAPAAAPPNASAVEKQRDQVANFVESLRARGRFPPAFERWGVQAFMERLAAAETPPAAADPSAPLRADKSVCPTEEDSQAPEPTLLAWFQEFLTKLPAVIEFRELGSHESPVTSHQSRPVVRFTEPPRGMAVDPASVELAERAEALAAELGISYAEALGRLREEHRRTLTSA